MKMETLKSKALAIVALATLISMSIGAVNYFAKAGDLRLVEMRLEQKIIKDDLRATEQRIWQLEDRLEERPNDKIIKEQIRILDQQKRNLEIELNKTK